MGCCCKKDHQTKQEKSCCVCNPFEQDGWLLTAQITSIVGACLSWVWWPLFVISAPIVVILQTTCCCKMKKQGLVAACIISFLAFGLGLFIGIWMSVKCWNRIFVVILNDDHYYYHGDGYYDDYYRTSCDNWLNNPTAWTVVAFVDAALFLLTFVCSTYFVCYRYDDKVANWSRAQCEADADEVVVPVVEMGVIPPSATAPHATATIVANEKDMDHA